MCIVNYVTPGCSYHMTSYRVEDVVDADPAFGIQLHHPRFLECTRAPESARLLGHSPAEWVRTMDRQDVMVARCWPYGFESAGVGSVRDVAEPDVIRGAPFILQTRNLPSARCQRRGPGAPVAPRGHPDGGHGIVAVTDWPG